MRICLEKFIKIRLLMKVLSKRITFPKIYKSIYTYNNYCKHICCLVIKRILKHKKYAIKIRTCERGVVVVVAVACCFKRYLFRFLFSYVYVRLTFVLSFRALLLIGFQTCFFFLSRLLSIICCWALIYFGDKINNFHLACRLVSFLRSQIISV